ncbi:hypothetical protein [Cryobacterium sp. TMT4-31]|uniref:hypothetical protein n=1 Tax=Cryobacterium sp. TMT4-31 TaxID=1259259 RepID=UPI0010691176|nr:hypothetical protein [Cryobacterium sp. TMT4-31]TFC84852.1 hypothetical protein E3T19_17960 [Cryobacterium sp. TMT4-31]
MTEAVRIITEQVRLRVRRDGVDLAADDALADQYVRDEVRRYSERALGGSLPLLTDEFQASREVVAALTGFGALQPFLDDPDIEEIWIISPKGLRSLELRGLDVRSPQGVRSKRQRARHQCLRR